MCDLKAIFALLIILPSAALAQNAPNDKPNACNDVHWTKKRCALDQEMAMRD
jgi:hypothetical protein